MRRLSDFGMGVKALEWFKNNLADRTQAEYTKCPKLSLIENSKGS